MKKGTVLVVALVAISGCALGEDEGGIESLECAEDEVLIVEDDYIGCEADDALGAEVETGVRYVGRKIGYRTYLKVTCYRRGGVKCGGFQLRNSPRADSRGCRTVQKRKVRRETTGKYRVTGQWRNTYLRDCR